MLNLKEIKKDYATASETVHALRGVSVAFRKNEFVSILGPSGCGKTTLLNIIGGLDHYTGGDLVINGRSTKSYKDRDWDVYRNHRIGFIFQSYNLIPHQTVLGNVELALTIAGISREERIRRAKKALDRVGLSDQYYKKPNQLSGGQCQRVAIARALVNDPEILLADEPTGALDTVTSVQIMDLIKEISGERLVIMVTHNPELAEKYSSRIIRLLDGQVIEDTAPYSSEEEEAENNEQSEQLPTLPDSVGAIVGNTTNNGLRFALVKNGKKAKKAIQKLRKKKSKKEKAKMSFFTAFMLSAKNLMSKKGRTAMVGFAGSIGIIGIAMVLAFSAGIKGYISSMQDDMLSGNPITITESAYDLDALTGMMDTGDKIEIIKKPNRVYISSLVEYLAEMDKGLEDIMVKNNITKEYIDYIKAMPEEYYNAMLLSYGIDMNNSIYTGFKLDSETDEKLTSVSAITAMYTSILKETEFSDYASYVTALAPSMAQMPNNKDYLLSQYDLVSGDFPEGKGEIMLVLNSDDELSDLLLARFGYYTQEEFLEIVKKATSEDGSYDESVYRDSFAYDELIGKEMVWYPNDVTFEKNETTIPGTNQSVTSFGYNAYADSFTDTEKAEGLKLTVVGILTTKENVNYGSIQSGIYYTEALTQHVLSENKNSEIFDYINGIDESSVDATAMYAYYLPYSYTYNYDANDNGAYEPEEVKTAMGMVGPTSSMSDMMGSMMGGSNSAFDHKATKEKFIRNLGGNDLANNVSIYPVSFDDKNLVTNYLEAWNGEGSLTYGDVTLTRDERTDITFTDTLELIINMINTMIDVISYALIAFTSISLVVSTVMIGIITYVSVVERIKEIGVIRALGGRKKDVSHLFNAETFIIGLLAGIFGVLATYLISAVVNAILKPLIGYSSIAALPISDAVVLVIISVLLTLISGLIPAKSAAKKDPVVALRTE
ncbi:MAG: ABC transporter ATP-binding protein/permease [Clostridia bacterium]|nr:ABC transporter ATP-binding protein/permease [Clostridia bacterium]